MNRMYPYRHYLVTIALFALITLVSQLFEGELEMINIALMHLLPVIVIALNGNMIATTVVTTASIAILALFYIPPHLSFYVHELFYLWSFAIFYLVGYTITFQAKRIHATSIKETLLNTLSHDLKTPLSSILGNATLLAENDRLDAAIRKEMIIQIKESSLKMNRLICNLLDSARLQHGHTHLRKEWCDFEDLLGVALQEFRNDSRTYPFEIHIEPDLPLFQGDCSLLARLLVNLIDNALKYSDADKPVRITMTSTPKTVTIQVFNECRPIKKADLKNMFDKFYRLENTADIHGSGIGLSICKEIAEAHRGTIEAFNTKGGVSLAVTLPILKHANV